MPELPLPDLPCSKRSLVRLGEALRDGTLAEADVGLYDSFMDVCDQRRSLLLARVREIDWRTPLGRNVELDTSSRTKTRRTLVEKLRREHLRLPAVRDIIGLRIVGEISLADQDQIASRLVEALPNESYRLVDRRERPVCRVPGAACHPDATRAARRDSDQNGAPGRMGEPVRAGRGRVGSRPQIRAAAGRAVRRRA